MKGKERERGKEGEAKQVGNLKRTELRRQREEEGWEARAAQSGRRENFTHFLSILKKTTLHSQRYDQANMNFGHYPESRQKHSKSSLEYSLT